MFRRAIKASIKFTRYSNMFFIIAALLLLLTLSAKASEKLTIVTTTGMIADTARIIGGEHVDVSNLMGSGVDPHAYRQTRSDIVKLSKADLVLWHGLYLEAQLEPLMEKLTKRGNVFAVAESVSTDQLLAHDDYEGQYDPHIWMNPEIWKQVANEINRIFAEAKPESANLFEHNLQLFVKELDALQDYSKAQLAKIPTEQRILVTAHDAFNYFGDAYDFEVLGIQGLSTESEAGIRRIQEMVDFLVERKLGAVFVETSVSDRNIQALIEGAAAKGHKVIIGGALFSDAMGPAGTYEGTYIGMIVHNITTISKALGADVPAQGMQGRLIDATKGAS